MPIKIIVWIYHHAQHNHNNINNWYKLLFVPSMIIWILYGTKTVHLKFNNNLPISSDIGHLNILNLTVLLLLIHLKSNLKTTVFKVEATVHQHLQLPLPHHSTVPRCPPGLNSRSSPVHSLHAPLVTPSLVMVSVSITISMMSCLSTKSNVIVTLLPKLNYIEDSSQHPW